jgi:shikimate kinase
MDGIQGRPLFTDESKARVLYALRDPLYGAYAHHIIDIDGQTIDAIGHEVIQKAMQNAK